MDHILVHEKTIKGKVKGKYVALTDDKKRKVVGASKDPKAALEEAAENGYSDAVLLYVPAEKEGVLVY